MRKSIIRKCIVTNERFEKKDLIRVVRTPEGSVVIDKTGRLNGRGAYIVARKAVILEAQKKNIFARHLEVEVQGDLYLSLLELARE